MSFTILPLKVYVLCTFTKIIVMKRIENHPQMDKLTGLNLINLSINKGLPTIENAVNNGVEKTPKNQREKIQNEKPSRSSDRTLRPKEGRG